MKIIISGGTGMIGTALIKELHSRGHISHVISRNPPRKKFHYQEGVENYILLNDFLNGVNCNIEDYDAAVNLAGAPIAGDRWTEDYKKKIMESRIKTTKAFSEQITDADNPPRVFLSGSAVGYYGDAGDKLLTEETPPGDDFLAEVCKKWEEEAAKAKDSTRLAICRIGLVLSPTGGALEKLVLPYKMFLGGSVGSGGQWIPWIHLSDLINIFIWILEHKDCEGAFNCTAPNPVKMDHFSEDLGDALYRPSFMKVPSFAVKMILGESATMLLASQRAVPKAALENGYEFFYPELKPALANLLRKDDSENGPPKPIPK